MRIVTSFIPFAPIAWWSHVINAEEIIFDGAEHFEKMSYRNRYRISGANNPIQLSVPLVSGRNQRTTMAEVQISNSTQWQVQHWRTLVSVYRQTPFWEFYEQSLEVLFNTPYNSLIDFNLATFHWVSAQLKYKCEVSVAQNFLPSYPQDVIDFRKMKPATERHFAIDFPRYYQVFEDRIGFQANLSILDLLFSEGPQTLNWLKQNAQAQPSF